MASLASETHGYFYFGKQSSRTSCHVIRQRWAQLSDSSSSSSQRRKVHYLLAEHTKRGGSTCSNGDYSVLHDCHRLPDGELLSFNRCISGFARDFRSSALLSHLQANAVCSNRQTDTPSALSVVAFSWLTVRWACAAPRRPMISIPRRRRRQQVTGSSKWNDHSREIQHDTRLIHVEVAKTRERCSSFFASAGRMSAPRTIVASKSFQNGACLHVPRCVYYYSYI